jgi:hypothetical protein
MSIQYNVDICQNSLVLYDHTAQYATNDKYSVYDASTNARVTMNVDGTLTGNVSTIANLTSLLASHNDDVGDIFITNSNDIIILGWINIYIVYNGTNTAVHLAGGINNSGNQDGNGTNASFFSLSFMAADSNNIYVTDMSGGYNGQPTIRKIDLSGNVSTIYVYDQYYYTDRMIVVSNNLYVMRSFGINNSHITIDKINLSNNTLTTLVTINEGNGTGFLYNSLSYYNNHLYFGVGVGINRSIRKVSLIDNSLSTVLALNQNTPYWDFNKITVIPSGPFAGNFIASDSNAGIPIWIDLSGNYGQLCGAPSPDGSIEDGLGSNARIGYPGMYTINPNSNDNSVYLSDNDEDWYLRKIDLYPGSISNAAGPTQTTNVLSGNFLVNSTTNAITAFYNNNAPSTNLLLTSGNTNGADYIYSSGNFSSNGTTITSISTAVDTEYGASGWLIYYDNATSTTLFQYKNASNTWVSVPSSATTFSITEVLDNSPQNNVPCFNQGTKILCLVNEKEENVEVENLKKGDMVKTYLHGYKKIKQIGVNRFVNEPSTYRKCMYVMKKEKNAELLEDLIVTGDHSILVDRVSGQERMEMRRRWAREERIGPKKLVMSSVSKEFEKREDTNEYTYYHFCVEDEEKQNMKFGVWSNGVLSEIPSAQQFKELELVEKL